MKVYIPSDLKADIKKKSLFLLVRPFFSENEWVQKGDTFDLWDLDSSALSLADDVSNADLLLIPYPINYYFERKLEKYLDLYNRLCDDNKIQGFGFISGDYGHSYPEFKHITYFRMGGFKSQLSVRNQGFPAALSDQHLILFGTKDIQIREKKEKPVVGFCGHADLFIGKRIKETLQFIFINAKRWLRNPVRDDYEPLFPSGYQRAKLLTELESCQDIATNFIYRNRYRAGATSEEERKVTTMEYYNNVRDSDYIICLRGGGNFSIRLYETLMMGRVPVFINTDCLLPFPEWIDWKQHVVWVDWEERHYICDIIVNFHRKLSEYDFSQIQINNRKLWLEKLQPKYILNNLTQNT